MPGGVPQPLPAWSMTIPGKPADGVNPPVAPVTIGGGLTDPDADGHSWAVLALQTGTIDVTVRLPWQNADQVGAVIAQLLAQIKAMAAAKAGPQLIVPPAGTSLPNLGINGNGKRP